MVNQDIVNYLREGKKRGFGLALLKKKLLEGGFEEEDIEEAIMTLPVENDFSATSKPIEKPLLKAQSSAVSSDKLSFFKKINAALINPRLLFEKTDADGIKPTLGFQELLALIPFLVIGLGIAALVSFVISAAPPGSLLGVILPSLSGVLLVFFAGMFAVGTFILLPLVLFVVAGVTHLFVILMKGQGKYKGTFKALVYGAIPNYIVMPFLILISFVGTYGSTVAQIISLIVGIWSFVLMIRGLKYYHKCSGVRAFFMALLGTIFSIMLSAALVLGAALLSPQPPQFGFG